MGQQLVPGLLVLVVPLVKQCLGLVLMLIVVPMGVQVVLVVLQGLLVVLLLLSG